MEFKLRGDDLAAAAFLARVRAIGPSCIDAVDVVAREGATFMRRAAITALLEWDVARGQARALEALVPDAHEFMRVFALSVLAHAPSRESLDAIIATLGAKQVVHEAACNALAKRVKREPSLVRYLVMRSRTMRAAGALPTRSGGRALKEALRTQREAHDALLMAGAPHCGHEYDAYIAEVVDAGEAFPREIVRALAAGSGAMRERTLLRIEKCVDAGCAEEARLARVRREIANGTPEDAAVRLPVLVAEAQDTGAIPDAVARVFAGSPRFAYESLAPMLDAAADPTTPWPRGDVAEAAIDCILRAHLDARPVDARFLPHVRPLSAEGHYLNLEAEDCVEAFAWVEGGRSLPWIPEVSLPGDEGPPLAEPMPLLLAGIEVNVGDAVGMARVRDLFARTDAPPGLAAYCHQFRGLRCDQFALVGYAVAPPTALTSALEAFDADGSVQWGAAYPAETLAHGRAAIERIFHFGPITHAFEALLLAAPCAPARTMAGYDVLRFVDQPAWRDALPRPWMRSVRVTSGDTPQRIGTYGEAHDRALAAVGYAIDEPLCAAIVWGNSD